MPARLDWPSAVGNFLLNFGVLDLGILDFLEAHSPPAEYAKVKHWHLRDRLALMQQHVERSGCSRASRAAFDRFILKLEPIRKLRNHIAHGTMRLTLAADLKTWVVTLSMPRDIDGCGSLSPDARHLEFAELTSALSNLSALIEEFDRLSDGWHKETSKGNHP